VSGWLAEEALHPDVRRMEGEPDRTRELAQSLVLEQPPGREINRTGSIISAIIQAI